MTISIPVLLLFCPINESSAIRLLAKLSNLGAETNSSLIPISYAG
jgi:hypothetical protein